MNRPKKDGFREKKISLYYWWKYINCREQTLFNLFKYKNIHTIHPHIASSWCLHNKTYTRLWRCSIKSWYSKHIWHKKCHYFAAMMLFKTYWWTIVPRSKLTHLLFFPYYDLLSAFYNNYLKYFMRSQITQWLGTAWVLISATCAL